MGDFEPFDSEYSFDKTVLTEDFPNYLLPSVQKWIIDVLHRHDLFDQSGYVAGNSLPNLSNDFTMPFNRTMRTTYKNDTLTFINIISANNIRLRNTLSYILQKIADYTEGATLEEILSEGSSAYTVDITRTEVKRALGAGVSVPYENISMKLVYRVPLVVKAQAETILKNEHLLAEAWDEYYGLSPDDEKVVTRCHDALSGILRDKYFPKDAKPQLGKLTKQLIESPKKFTLPAETMYDKKSFLGLMDKFSEKRGNHTKGTGKKPTHEEAGFVLHYTIMLFQLFRIS